MLQVDIECVRYPLGHDLTEFLRSAQLNVQLVHLFEEANLDHLVEFVLLSRAAIAYKTRLSLKFSGG